MTGEAEVLIVGAGPTGLALAVELARRGVIPRLIDRHPHPTGDSRAPVVQAGTEEAFDAMGIGDKIAERAYRLEYVSLHAFGRLLGGIPVAGIGGRGGPRTIGQNDIEQILSARLVALGGRIERGAEAVDIVHDAEGVDVDLATETGPSRARARYVIGCDGRDSLVRKTAGIGLTRDAHTFSFLHADAHLRWAYPSGRAYVFVERNALIVLLPFDATGHYRILCAQPEKPGTPPVDTSIEEIEAILRRVVDAEAVIEDPRWLHRWQSTHQFAASLRRERLLLAGDSGHVHLAVAGQGLNSGIQDAFNLGWKLAGVVQGRLSPDILDTYAEERQPVAEELMRSTDRGFHVMVGTLDLAGFAMKLFGSGAIALEAVQDRLRRLVGEVAPSYQAGALAEDHGGSIGPVAGERGLDAVVVRARDRLTLRLFEALDRNRWTLLVFAGLGVEPTDLGTSAVAELLQARWPDQIETILITPGQAPADWLGTTLIDRECTAHDRWGVRSATLYLIRPDNHIGFRAPAARLDALTAYLERWFGD
jgi:2-polyprenyl-6-methoxyphenol hydroxylase-like FAD-dependent oxidoreductase